MKSYQTNYYILTKLLSAFAFSILLFLLCTLIRGLAIGKYFNPIYISSTVGFVLYFILTSKQCHKYSTSIPSWQILISILAGLLVLQLPCRIITFRETLVTLPELTCHLSSILLAYFAYRKELKIWLAWGIGAFFILSTYVNLLITT